MGSISQIPRGHHRQKTKLLETSRLHKTKNGQENEFTQSAEFTIGRQRKNDEEYIHSNYTINTGVRISYLRNNDP